jgi:hypothetical protein
MLSYVYFGTNDLERAITFYNATLTPLGMKRCITGDRDWDRIAAGWGIYEADGARELAFWIGIPFNQQPATVGNGSMVAFNARSWKEGTTPAKAAPSPRSDLFTTSGSLVIFETIDKPFRLNLDDIQRRFKRDRSRPAPTSGLANDRLGTLDDLPNGSRRAIPAAH